MRPAAAPPSLLRDNGFAETALNPNFAADDDKARRFLRNDIGHILRPIRIAR
jgi:hypothetical protein